MMGLGEGRNWSLAAICLALLGSNLGFSSLKKRGEGGIRTLGRHLL
jgi:hypothetical protein